VTEHPVSEKGVGDHGHRGPARRRTAGAVSDSLAMPLAKSAKVAVKAVTEMPGTCSARMAFICRAGAGSIAL
jgi:hypothetical protein